MHSTIHLDYRPTLTLLNLRRKNVRLFYVRITILITGISAKVHNVFQAKKRSSDGISKTFLDVHLYYSRVFLKMLSKSEKTF